MLYKFRQRVRVKAFTSKLVMPDGSTTQTEFFQGTEGAVIRHDEAKGGYLVVLDCPEIKAAMGETITAYFGERDLEPAPAALTIPDAAKPGPFEYPTDTNTSGLPYLPNQLRFNTTASPMIKL